jgi:putative membrane protein
MLVKGKFGCTGLLIAWVLSAAAVWLTAYFVPGVEVDGFKRALVVAVVIGLLNTIVRPLLVLLTLPVTILTLGLFLLVINGAMVGLAGYLLDGFTVEGPIPAIIAAVVLTVISALLGWIFGTQKDED